MQVLQYVAKAVTANLLPDDLFRDDITTTRARELFSMYVEVVEIENHSYCNRTCWFCPNAQLDRRSKTVLMSDSLFDKILADLESVDYDQSLVWSRYHEPLAHDSIYGRIEQARRKLPKAYLTLISNGDYLNHDTLRRLEITGINRLLLDLYLPAGKERDEAVAKYEVERFAARTGLHVVQSSEHFECSITGSPIKISMGIPNYTLSNISTRGGLVQVPLLDSYQRVSTCFSPLRSVVIDYNGKGMLCCQTRSDAPQHQGAIIGDLNEPEYTLFHFYRDLGPSRLGLLSPGPKKGVCKTCTVSATGPNRLSRNPLIHTIASKIPGASEAFDLIIRRVKQRRRWEG